MRLLILFLLLPSIVFGQITRQGVNVQNGGSAQGFANTLNCDGTTTTCTLSGSIATISSSGGSSKWTESGTNLYSPITDTVTVGTATTTRLSSIFTVNGDEVLGNGIVIDDSTSSSPYSTSSTGSTNTANAIGTAGGLVYVNAQTFVLSSSTTISSGTFKLNANNGSPTGTITVSIVTTSGGVPTGTLADASLTVAVTPTASATNSFTFSAPASIAPGTYAVMFASTSAQTNGNFWQQAADSTNPYAGGVAYYNEIGGTGWTAPAGWDFYFSLSGTSGGIGHPPLILSISGVQKAKIWVDGDNSNRLTETVATTDTSTTTTTNKTLNTDLTMADGKNIAVNTTTGTKIGTSTTQKIGFFNATPVVQQLATTDLGTVLSNLGLRASGTAYPITTSGTKNFGDLTTSQAVFTDGSNNLVSNAITGSGSVAMSTTPTFLTSIVFGTGPSRGNIAWDSTNTTYSSAGGNNLLFKGPATASAVTTGSIAFSNLSAFATNSSGQDVFVALNHTVNSSGTGGNTTFLIKRTDTGNGSSQQNLIDTQVSSTSMWRTDNLGHHFFNATNTAGGTTGAQTINKPSGTVNFAAAATTLTVTNSLVSTSSIVFCVVRTNDSTATIKNVVPSSGSFVITLTAAATAETSVGFLVIN